METIYQFNGEYRYLSNFWLCSFEWNNFLWPSSEHAYQAAKSLNYHEWAAICQPHITPGQAKRLGKCLAIRPDWEQIKVGVMEEIVTCKFLQNPELFAMLKATGSADLQEGNTWGDKIWGISPPASGKGQNLLGKILMQVREL